MANNTVGNCEAVVGATIISLGYNLDSDGTCNLGAANDQPNTNPLLGPLADNGGDTQTHALTLNSPALDQGSC
ncbi:MAG TPA: choice-of-anchor Q domain-containing protein, partial [Anaerolineae bacterium]